MENPSSYVWSAGGMFGPATQQDDPIHRENFGGSGMAAAMFAFMIRPWSSANVKGLAGPRFDKPNIEIFSNSAETVRLISVRV